jgi:hypothetical protein
VDPWAPEWTASDRWGEQDIGTQQCHFPNISLLLFFLQENSVVLQEKNITWKSRVECRKVWERKVLITDTNLRHKKVSVINNSDDRKRKV